MKPFLILLSSLLLSSGLQLHAAPDKPSKAGPELLAPFSSAENLKSNFSCYDGPFASYDNWLAMLSKKPKFNAEQFAEIFPKAKFEQRQQQIDCRIFVYESDGNLVEGIMLNPDKNASADKKLPVVIYNRGGNAEGGKFHFGAIQRALMPLAEQGYVVIASQYRGATGFRSGIKAQPLLDQFG